MPELPEELRSRPARSPGQQPTATLTFDAYRRIKAELEHLTTIGREQVTEKIKIAREHGDLKENAEYHAAKDEQGLMESKIRKLQHMLTDPEIVEAPPHADEIAAGMLVTIRPLDEPDPDDGGALAAWLARSACAGRAGINATLLSARRYTNDEYAGARRLTGLPGHH